MKRIFNLLIVFSFFITSCAHYEHLAVNRNPASENIEQITHYLNIDKFKYYINEYSVAMEGKIPDEIIAHLRSISIEDILKMELPEKQLSDAQNYDNIIFTYLKENNLLNGAKKEDLKWNYNFFRNKLNEAFTLTPSKFDAKLSISAGEEATEREIPVEKAIYAVDEMTLDSGHYISNRTTRAIFWEAIENNRAIEFHLGDSREFLKTLNSQGGEILFEVRPLAKNYNKIFIVQYPNEKTYRYAITNIGGNDRLNHLTNQLSLSNLSGGKLKTKVVVKGDLAKFHQARTEEHILQLKHLPKADRVIIGQKESIDGKFNIFWKMKALKTLYEDEPKLFKDVDEKLVEKFLKLESANLEVIFKDKKIVEDLFAHFEEHFNENPEKLPGKFKIFNYDNFTIEMCDYVFQNESGKNIRWRVVSNVWGDEIVPIAQAFKATGHTNVTYMGTAGAFDGKGYKVGDLVVPNAVVDLDKKINVKSNSMKIEGAKYGGAVEHVGSPFEETADWLSKAKARSEFVEVETSYLRQIFNGPTDNVEMYLLISDILGSDTETLAHATSSKRKNSQNRLLAELFKRDVGAGHIPSPVAVMAKSSDELLREAIDNVLASKGIAYRYFVYSSLRSKKKVTEDAILEFAEKNPAYSDAFAIDKLVKIGEVISETKRLANVDASIGIPESILNGTWNPKTDSIEFVFISKNESEKAALEKAKKTIETKYKSHFKNFNISIDSSADSKFYTPKISSRIDPDFVLKTYSYAGMNNYGLTKNVTYNGGITFGSLPTANFSSPLENFKAFVSTNPPKSTSKEVSGCAELVNAFMLIAN